MNTLLESDVHRFNLNTLELDKELESFKIDLLLLPSEIQKRAVVAAQWHTAMDRQVCPLCNSMQGEIIPVDSSEWGRIFPPIHLGCFLSNRTPIYTLDGWKKIGMIKVDDYVLTHKGRFRRVMRLFRSRSYRGKVIMVTMKGSFKRFVVTPEHPFLTEAGWKKAIDLKTSDEIMIMASRCKRCKRLIPYYLKYCSRSCNSKDITDKQWNNPEHRKLMSSKTSQQLKHEYKLGIRDPREITKIARETVQGLIESGVEWGFQNAQHHKIALNSRDLDAMRKASSQRMIENNPSHLPSFSEHHSKHMKQYLKEHPEKHPNFIMAQKGHMTKIEKSIGEVLQSLGLNVIFNYPIDGYFIDWAIPSLKIGIECDGAYWHQNKQRDSLRDKKIEKFGWTLLRLKESEIENNIELCREKISRLVNNHLGNYEFLPLQIKAIKVRALGRGRMLYNFAVEEDESYIAKGLVSHNCRCNLSYITADERGVVERLKRHKPIDPVLLKHWSSKIYTDAEIKAMAKKRPDLLPSGKRTGFNLPETVRTEKEYIAIMDRLDDKGVQKAYTDIKNIFDISNLKERVKQVEKNWEKYYIARRRWTEWKRLQAAQFKSVTNMQTTMRIEATREKLAQTMLTKKYKSWKAIAKDWDELVKITGTGTGNEKWIWTEYLDYRHALQVDWAAVKTPTGSALARLKKMDEALNKWIRQGGQDPLGIKIATIKQDTARYLFQSNRIELGWEQYFYSHETCIHEYSHALETRMLKREFAKFNIWHKKNIKINFTTAHMRNQTYYLERQEFTEEWAISIDNILAKLHDSPQRNFAHSRVKAKIKELLSDVFIW